MTTERYLPDYSEYYPEPEYTPRYPRFIRDIEMELRKQRVRTRSNGRPNFNPTFTRAILLSFSLIMATLASKDSMIKTYVQPIPTSTPTPYKVVAQPLYYPFSNR